MSKRPALLDAGGRPIRTTKPPPDQPTKLPAKPPEPTVLSIIAQVASDPRADPEKMRLLLDMQKEVRAEESRMTFLRAMLALRKELPSINKDGKIEIHPKPGARSQRIQITLFASFENLHTSIEPILLRHGFVLWFEPAERTGGPGIKIIGHLDHIEGHGVTCSIPLPSDTTGSKNENQGVGSAISYGKRYATIALLNIRSEAKEDKDVDGFRPKDIEQAAVELISPEQLATLIRLKDEVGAELDKFIDYLNRSPHHEKIKGLAQLPASRFREAESLLKSKRAAGGGKP